MTVLVTWEPILRLTIVTLAILKVILSRRSVASSVQIAGIAILSRWMLLNELVVI